MALSLSLFFCSSVIFSLVVLEYLEFHKGSKSANGSQWVFKGVSRLFKIFQDVSKEFQGVFKRLSDNYVFF